MHSQRNQPMIHTLTELNSTYQHTLPPNAIPKTQPNIQLPTKPYQKSQYPTQQPNPYAKPFSSKCFRCQQPGHMSNKCPQMPTNLIEDCEGETDEENEFIEVCDGGKVTHEHEGDLAYSFIVQKLLLTPRQLFKKMLCSGLGALSMARYVK